MTWTKDTVKSIGRTQELYFHDYVRRLERARTDSRRAQRATTRQCKFCFYVASGLNGQAFTDWSCCLCGTDGYHPNTATPKLCDACADTLGACVRCGGTRAWAEKGAT